MRQAPEPEAIPRRRALSLLGLAAMLGLAAPRVLLTATAADAQAIPPAFDQADKPLPGEAGRPRTPTEGEKPIPSVETATYRRRARHKPVQERRVYRRRRRSTPSAAPAAGETKPGQAPFLPSTPSTAPRRQ